MNTLLAKSTLAAAIALTIIACAPEGGSVAGIGGSGYVSSGSVSGFGSVFVNGVEFETDSATFDVDGVSGTQSDLAIGMVVRVNGTINDDGITGTASSISFDDELQGPVSAVGISDADGIKRSITILGVTVIVDSGSTTFDIDTDNVPPATVFDFTNIALDNNIEVSGFFDTNGNLQATRVELKELIFNPAGSIVEIEGVITNYVNNSNFKIGTITVDATTATLDDLPNGLANNLLVEAKGTLDAGYTMLTASKIEGEDDSAEDTEEFEIEGIMTDYDSINQTFNIDGLTVDASNASKEPATLILENDLRVEVEGAIINGVLIAKEIESEGGDIKVHATVTSVDTNTNTFTLRPVSTQPEITVTVTTGTQIEDDVNEKESYTLFDLENDMSFVEVRGYDDGNGGITAVEVDVKEESNVVVQSIIQSGANPGTVKVLGIEFIIQYPGQTEFENNIDAPISQVDFFSAVTLDSTLIKVEDDKTVDGIANEIDIESP